jgi:hypothetical protein
LQCRGCGRIIGIPRRFIRIADEDGWDLTNLLAGVSSNPPRLRGEAVYSRSIKNVTGKMVATDTGFTVTATNFALSAVVATVPVNPALATGKRYRIPSRSGTGVVIPIPASPFVTIIYRICCSLLRRQPIQRSLI